MYRQVFNDVTSWELPVNVILKTSHVITDTGALYHRYTQCHARSTIKGPTYNMVLSSVAAVPTTSSMHAIMAEVRAIKILNIDQITHS